MESEPPLAYDYLSYAYEEFKGFVATRAEDAARFPDDFRYLQDHLVIWLEQGRAVEVAGGKFDTYLRVVVRIIDEWVRDPTLGGVLRQPVEGVLDVQRDGYLCIDPDYFAARALKKALRQRGESD